MTEQRFRVGDKLFDDARVVSTIKRMNGIRVNEVDVRMSQETLGKIVDWMSTLPPYSISLKTKTTSRNT